MPRVYPVYPWHPRTTDECSSRIDRSRVAWVALVAPELVNREADMAMPTPLGERHFSRGQSTTSNDKWTWAAVVCSLVYHVVGHCMSPNHCVWAYSSKKAMPF
jgi:hypothetical protein